MPIFKLGCLPFSILSLSLPVSWSKLSPNSSLTETSLRNGKRKPRHTLGWYSVSPKSSPNYHILWSAQLFSGVVGTYPCLARYMLLTSRYATAGLDLSAGTAGPVFLTMFFYEMLYTGIGKRLCQAWADMTAQFIAAYSPNAPFAALLIPVVIAVLVTFSGVLVPYSQLTVFWKYWRK
jgi:ATP-binding cassette subfamily G (WHITE) protein 2 (SNQ2)